MGSQVGLRRKAALAVGAALLALGACHKPDATAQRCSALRSVGQRGLEILSAEDVAAGLFTAPDGQVLKVPRSCRVAGIARGAGSEIGFELWLPQPWSGRYVQLGNGGFAGNIDQPSLAAEIGRGNAVAVSDTGHKGGQFDASWARGHPERVVDYGHRSIRVTANASQELIRAYYGRSARRRYFIGCSNGGRQALIAAQRYPEDWDGILAGSPAVQWTKQLATFAAIQHQLRLNPANWIPPSKLPAIQRAALASCPPGTVSAHVPDNPRLCRFDSRRLLCKAEESSECLTAAQIVTVDLIRFGPLDRQTGRRLYSGFEATSAAAKANWDQWILNADRDAPSQLAFATQAYRHLVLGRPDWQVEEFTPNSDFASAQRLAPILDANADLGGFARKGGKLIMYVGWADAVISPTASVAYYQGTIGQMGRLATERFFRLFMVPGMQHCQGGPAPNAFGQARISPPLRPDTQHDIRSALEQWVEHGRPPQKIVATKYEDDRPGGPAMASRELQPYPRPPSPILAVR